MATLVSYALVTLNEVKEALDISGADHDAKLNGYINRATDLIEAYCQRRFLSTVYSNELYSGNGTQFLPLRNYPVSTLTSLESMTGDFASPAWDSIDSSSYTLKTEGGKDQGIIYMISRFHKGVDNFRVNYTAGYATQDAIPNDLREACIELVNYFFSRRRATPGVKSETLGRYSYTMSDMTTGGLIKGLGLDAILDLYRTVAV